MIDVHSSIPTAIGIHKIELIISIGNENIQIQSDKKAKEPKATVFNRNATADIVIGVQQKRWRLLACCLSNVGSEVHFGRFPPRSRRLPPWV